jgi:thymidylate synthase ThyX
MKVTQVAICPSEASQRAARPALTPELLAASGARYSRNNEGLEAILSKIDPHNLEKSVDSIFRMVDYGHQSIADMVPVAMFIDGISIWLAYHVWTLCPTAGGQESSTRYLKLSAEGLIAPEKLGIPADEAAAWTKLMVGAFEAYQSALHIWEEVGNANPALMGIPQSLLNDASEAAQKKVQRMKRNYAFDRARYFMPVGAATNIMMVMSARAWVYLCQHLLSHPLPEPRRLGEAIRDELSISAPRMLRHAKFLETTQRATASEFQKVIQMAANAGPVTGAGAATPYLEVMLPAGASGDQMAADLAQHQNRYAPMGSSLQRTSVRFGWSAIGFAEIRDLNRHRTGSKYCPLVPRGFYAALDQLTPAADPRGEKLAALSALAKIGHTTIAEALLRLRMASPSYVYWTLLGTEYPFEHVTTADKFIYEAELRTGVGAHFRYAKHLRDVLALWYEKFPATRKLILEGDAEPE